ncbi:hypothetical protein FQR65_LT09615 [Abscondita terminalis]|nr:hypothetical protein FQR65_LT09615 [Abscondita terminalis]
MFYWNIVYLFLFLKLISCPYITCQEASDDINPCDEKFHLVTDHSYEECGPGTFFKKVGNKAYSCFSTCVAYDLSQNCGSDNECPPGYVCDDPIGATTPCRVDENSCLKKWLQPTNPWQDAWKPSCLKSDGSWEAKQCKGEANNGICYCYGTSGRRIHGQAFMDKADNMTCACSRKKEELRNQGTKLYSTLHCDSMGNYEPLQCDDGQCWCSDLKTGELLSEVVPDSMMTLLPCYSQEDVGSYYMRPCESQDYAQTKILYEFSLHGTHHTNFPHIMCDDQGNYGYYQIRLAQAYCTWIDNSDTGYAAALDYIPKLNCYCARDKKIYEAVGATHYLICADQGGYNFEQYHQIKNQWYCVDEDGYKNSDFVDKKEDLPACASLV